MRLMLLLLAFVTPVLAPAAGAAAKPAAARELFQRGAQAYREARYRAAIDAFQAAYQIDHAPALIFNIGQAWEKLGSVANALRAYREYLRLDPRAADAKTVAASLHNLEKRLAAQGVQQVTIYSTPAGAQVRLDGKDVGKTPYSAELVPGRHRAVLRLAGHRRAQKEFMLLAQHAMDIDVTLDTVQGAAAATRGDPPRTKAPTTAPTTLRPRRHPIRLWTYLAAGTTVALLGSALGFELARRSAASDAAAEPEQLSARTRYDSAERRQLAARVLLAVGLADAVATGILLYLDLRRAGRPEHAATRLHVNASCGPQGCGLMLLRRF